MAALRHQKKPRTRHKYIQESADIVNFINVVYAENYALAHKYLERVIQDKIETRISSSLNEPLF